MRFTLICSCGEFQHNLPAFQMAMWAAHHPNALVLPADMYAEDVNDALAEAEWIVSP